MSDIRVLVSGSGRMGAEVLAGIAATAGFQPVGVLEKFAADDQAALPDGSHVPVGADPRALFDATRPDVLVDFTHHTWTETVAPLAVAAGIRPVIGTTGLPEGFVEHLAALCRQHGTGGVVAANFAIGAVLMMHFARLAAPFFSAAEIIELHHDRKIDAPSGTSLATARAMVEQRGRPFERTQTEKQTLAGTRGGEFDGITIHSVRLPGLVAHQEVLLGGRGETLTLRHDSLSRESFIPGVVLAVRAVMERTALVVGLDHLMGLA